MSSSSHLGKVSRQSIRKAFVPVLTTTKEALIKRHPPSQHKPTTTRRSMSVKSLSSHQEPTQRLRTEEVFPSNNLMPQFNRIQFAKKLKEYGIPPAKVVSQSFGCVKCYACISHRGIVKKENEDRMSVIPNVRVGQIWFSVYDGHGGSECVEYLEKDLPARYAKCQEDASISLMKSIAASEHNFLKKAYESKNHSGTCALIAVVERTTITVANIGDSRLLTSKNSGKVLIQTTQDHKPSLFSERERIIKAGGKVYEARSGIRAIHRVLPGKLSVSRTIGDLEAKLPQCKGNPNVVISTPDLFTIHVDPSTDFLLMASDGLFDVITNEQINDIVWKQIGKSKQLSECIGECVQALLIEAFDRQGTDNISVVMVAFQNDQKATQKTAQNRVSRTLSLKDFRQLSRNSFKRLEVVKQKTQTKV